MSIAMKYKTCVTALNDVVSAFRKCCEDLSYPQYESERTAFVLMQVTIRHVESLSAIASSPKSASHYITAWPILRTAFEASLTACWLAHDDEWMEREARWLGWMADDVRFVERLNKQLGSVADFTSAYEQGIRERTLICEEVSAKFTKPAYSKRADVRDMLKVCGFPDETYVTYCLGSSMLHCGYSSCKEVWDSRSKDVVKTANDFAKWSSAFKHAGWCVAEAGKPVLCRLGAKNDRVSLLTTRYSTLLGIARMVDK